MMESAWKQLSSWIHQGHLKPIIGHRFPFSRAAEAYQLLQQGSNFGKIVLQIV
jgi:NADPH:quinone reductase-like Zn-dependent oxidoreductase